MVDHSSRDSFTSGGGGADGDAIQEWMSKHKELLDTPTHDHFAADQGRLWFGWTSVPSWEKLRKFLAFFY